MSNLIEVLSGWVSFIVLVAGAIAAFLTWLTKPWKIAKKVDRAVEIIVGSPERRDALSGEVIAPRVLDIGTRMTHVEQTLNVAVVEVVNEAKAAARSAEECARAAEASAAAAAESARVACDLAEKMSHENRTMMDQLQQWQSVDRVKAEALTSMVNEMGLPEQTRSSHDSSE